MPELAATAPPIPVWFYRVVAGRRAGATRQRRRPRSSQTEKAKQKSEAAPGAASRARGKRHKMVNAGLELDMPNIATRDVPIS